MIHKGSLRTQLEHNESAKNQNPKPWPRNSGCLKKSPDWYPNTQLTKQHKILRELTYEKIFQPICMHKSIRALHLILL